MHVYDTYKVGIPPHVVKMKMQQEGLDSAVIDQPPDQRVPLKEEKKEKVYIRTNIHTSIRMIS